MLLSISLFIHSQSFQRPMFCSLLYHFLRNYTVIRSCSDSSEPKPKPETKPESTVMRLCHLKASKFLRLLTFIFVIYARLSIYPAQKHPWKQSDIPEPAFLSLGKTYKLSVFLSTPELTQDWLDLSP